LAGYEWVNDYASILGLIGANIQSHRLSAYDPTNSVQGTRAGVEVNLEIYANPSPNTLVAAYTSYSSAFNTYDIDLRPGVAVLKDIFVGPQIVFSGDDEYDEWRLGAHVTGIKIGPVETSIAAGYLNDSQQGGGAYGTLDLTTRF
jgi:hypothetical protein